jgi:hypothetical protein
MSLFNLLLQPQQDFLPSYQPVNIPNIQPRKRGMSLMDLLFHVNRDDQGRALNPLLREQEKQSLWNRVFSNSKLVPQQAPSMSTGNALLDALQELNRTSTGESKDPIVRQQEKDAWWAMRFPNSVAQAEIARNREAAQSALTPRQRAQQALGLSDNASPEAWRAALQARANATRQPGDIRQGFTDLGLRTVSGRYGKGSVSSVNAPQVSMVDGKPFDEKAYAAETAKLLEEEKARRADKNLYRQMAMRQNNPTGLARLFTR